MNDTRAAPQVFAGAELREQAIALQQDRVRIEVECLHRLTSATAAHFVNSILRNLS